MARLLRLGTRRSLLALAQSRQVARAIEAANSGVQVELVGIETKGDMLLDVSLQKTEGKDFFVAEIDKELLAGNIDFAVHSFKDLSLERPPQIVLAAVPERQFSHDIVFFHPRVRDRIRAGRPVRVGTSAPRRLENLPDFLSHSLPKLTDQAIQINFIEIRGNVNTRLSRLHERDDSARQLDGVVLALAGLNRLYEDADGRQELEKLLYGKERLLFQILPLSENPTAPAQGALAVECRANDLFTRDCLQKIHHEPSALAVERERATLRNFGGGCHQRFGATAIVHPDAGELFFVKGKTNDGKDLFLQEQHIKGDGFFLNGSVFNGMAKVREKNVAPTTITLTAPQEIQIQKAPAIFISHKRAFTSQVARLISEQILLVAGNRTWFHLAERGFWVSASADSLGSQTLFSLLERSPVLQIKNPLVLTHEVAAQRRDNSMATYYSKPSLFAEEVSQADVLYWASGSQFLAHREFVKPQARHACGCGDTVTILRQHGIEPIVIYNEEQLKKWSKVTDEY